MGIKNLLQPEVLVVDEKIRLKKFEEIEYEKGFSWYQDEKILYFSEGIKGGRGYSMKEIHKMYRYLSEIGELYLIQYREGEEWIDIGDVTLSIENMPIIIGESAYWGKGIGKRVLEVLLERARDNGIREITVPMIYHYNERSRRLFLSLGFKKIGSDEKGETFRIKFEEEKDMEITYRGLKELEREQVKALYDNAGWAAYTNDMDKLMRAIENSVYVNTAWCGEELVGLIRCVGDGETILYVQDILVNTEYKRMGIGRKLMEEAFEKFPNVRQKVLITEDSVETCSFYESMGLKNSKEYDVISFVSFS